MALTLVLIALVVLLVAWLASGIRVIHADHQAVIERFGRYRKTVGPGVRLTPRLIHTVRRVDQRETVEDIGTDVLTADDVTLGIDLAVFHACTDPRRFVYDVADFRLALTRLTETHLRSLAREMTMAEVLDEAGRLTAELTVSMGEIALSWGAQITRVEIARVELPSEIADAMKERVAAEQYRQAMAIEEATAVEVAAVKAEGEHQARLRRCQVKQSLLIMTAEREAAAMRILADAERYRQQAMARAQAEEIRIVSGAIQQSWAGPDRIGAKYLDVLSKNGAGREAAALPPPAA